jgi:pimeloyl-ACP methyl ester carboxylesterase
LGDYLDDVATVLATLRAVPEDSGRPLVLVGHSLGGMAVARYAEEHPVAGLVLVGSVTPHRWMRANMRASVPMLRRHPLTLLRALRQDFGLLFGSEQLVRELLVGQDAPQPVVAWLRAHLGSESTRMGSDLQALARRGLRPTLARRVRFIAGRDDAVMRDRRGALMAACAAEYRGAQAEEADALQLAGPHNLMCAGDTTGLHAAILQIAERCYAPVPTPIAPLA